MSKEINNGEAISIHVVDAPEAAAELRKAVGRKVGKARLTAVSEGPAPPSLPPSAFYIGDKDNPNEFACRENHVLSITGAPELVERGVTLGVACSGSPKPVKRRGLQGGEDHLEPTRLKISRIYR